MKRPRRSVYLANDKRVYNRKSHVPHLPCHAFHEGDTHTPHVVRVISTIWFVLDSKRPYLTRLRHD